MLEAPEKKAERNAGDHSCQHAPDDHRGHPDQLRLKLSRKIGLKPGRHEESRYALPRNAHVIINASDLPANAGGAVSKDASEQ